ncbi:tRNA ligase subunit PheS family protein [Candidatus Vidania fulgoroideorum]
MKKKIFKIKLIKFLKLNKFNFEDFKIIKFKILGKNGILNLLIKNSNIFNIKKVNSLKKKIAKILRYIKITKKKQNNNYINYFVFKNKKKITNNIYFYIKKIEDFFKNKGFEIHEGKEIESVKNNFTFLRSDKGHPSRSSKDTFYIKNNRKLLLRTHMTCLQKKYIKSNKKKIIFSGKVYRKDKGSQHLLSFNQIDGLILKEKEIDFRYFRRIFEDLILLLFKKKIHIRYRNSYFPFTLPSYEVDIKKNINDKWIEVGGAGEIHEDISPNYNGIAFGIGVERIIMIKKNLKNISLI